MIKGLVLGWLFAVSAVVALPATALADGCYLCGQGSSNGCQQCRYAGSDSFEQRKACEKKGCKVSGTGGCSQASNVKVCKVERTADILPASFASYPWFSPQF